MCISEKYFFSEIKYFAYVFAEHRIGTFCNIESDKVSFCTLIECFKFFYMIRNCFFENKYLEYI